MRRIVTRPRHAALGGIATLAALLALALVAGCGSSNSSKASPEASGSPGSPAAAVTYPATVSPTASGGASATPGTTSPGVTTAASASATPTAAPSPGTPADLGEAEVQVQLFLSALGSGDQKAAAALLTKGAGVPVATVLHGVKKFTLVSMTNEGQYSTTQVAVKGVVLVVPKSGSGATAYGWTRGNNGFRAVLARSSTNDTFKIISFQKL